MNDTETIHIAAKTIRSGRSGSLVLARKGAELSRVEHVTFGGADFVKFAQGRNVNGRPVMFEIPTAQARECIPTLFA